MNLEKIEYLITDALAQSEKLWSDKRETPAYIVGYLQTALHNIKYYVEQEIKDQAK